MNYTIMKSLVNNLEYWRIVLLAQMAAVCLHLRQT